MICERTVKTFCNEDLKLIENYEQATNDTTQTWHCHHRLEIDLGLSAVELIERKLYYNRPANELMFLTHSEHARLHAISENLSVETIRKRKEAQKGKPKSEEARKNMSKAQKGRFAGEKNPMYGKNSEDYMTPEAIVQKRKRQSESMIGKNSGKNHGMYGKPAANRGKHRVYTSDGKYHYE